MPQEHHSPCADALVLKTKLEALEVSKNREIDLLSKALIASENRAQETFAKLANLETIMTRLEAEMAGRVKAVEDGYLRMQGLYEEHMKDSKSRIEKIDDCDRFRKTGTWGFALLFSAVITQCVAYIFKTKGG